MLSNFTIGLNETQLGIVAPSWFIASMRNVIGFRQTEICLTTGQLLKTDEALKIGLIDEVVKDKEQGIARAEAFFQRFAKIPATARALSKLGVRGRDIEELKRNKEADLNAFLSLITSPKVQKGLELYLASLKKK